jgi:hypothetical protein
VDRRRFLTLSAGAGAVVGLALAQPRLGRAAPISAPAAGWTSATLDKRLHYTVGSVGDIAVVAGGDAYDARAGGGSGGWVPTDRVDLYDGATGAWTTATLSAARIEPTFASSGGKALLIGGRLAQGASDVIDVFDGAGRTWSAVRMSDPRQEPATAVAGSKVVIAGSRHQRGMSIELLDVEAGALTRLDLPTSIDVEDWVAAGQDSTLALTRVIKKEADTVYRVAADTGAVTTVALSKPRYLPKLRVAADRIFAVTGPNESETTLDAIDAAGQVTAVPLPRAGSVLATVVGGERLLFQPYKAPEAGAPTVYDLYDPARDRWLTVTLPRPRQGVRIVSHGDSLVFIGSVAAIGDPVSPFVDVYDTTTEQWTSSELSQGRGRFGVASLGSRLIVAGGSVDVQSRTKRQHFDTVDVFDAATGSWSTGQLSMAREAPQAAVLSNKVVFVGGELGCTSCPVGFLPPVVDVFDPSA